MSSKARKTTRRLVPVAAGIAVAAAVATIGTGTHSQLRPTVAGAPNVMPAKIALVSEAPTSHTRLGLPPLSARAHKHVAALQARVPRPEEQNEEEEIQNGESQNGYSTKLMTYRGGPVQTTPRIYLVFWGTSWFNGGDPNGVANRLHFFYQGVGGSAWADVLKQYGSNYGTFSNPTAQYQGWLKDSTPVPTNPTQADVAAAARRAAVAMNDFSYNAQYVIALPWGVVDQYSTANGFCAWHNWTSTTNGWITYTSLPYTPYMDAIGRGCGGGKVNGTSGTLDGVTINAGHEYAETVNDPGLNAWADSDGSENGDKCSWVSLGNRTLANGYSFPLQPTWSNNWRSQYGYGCYFS
jgi:hypothetical protein